MFRDLRRTPRVSPGRPVTCASRSARPLLRLHLPLSRHRPRPRRRPLHRLRHRLPVPHPRLHLRRPICPGSTSLRRLHSLLSPRRPPRSLSRSLPRRTRCPRPSVRARSCVATVVGPPNRLLPILPLSLPRNLSQKRRPNLSLNPSRLLNLCRRQSLSLSRSPWLRSLTPRRHLTWCLAGWRFSRPSVPWTSVHGLPPVTRSRPPVSRPPTAPREWCCTTTPAPWRPSSTTRPTPPPMPRPQNR